MIFIIFIKEISCLKKQNNCVVSVSVCSLTNQPAVCECARFHLPVSAVQGVFFAL